MLILRRCICFCMERKLALYFVVLRPTRSGHIEFDSITKRCYDSDASWNCCSTLILRLHTIRPVDHAFVLVVIVFGCVEFASVWRWRSIRLITVSLQPVIWYGVYVCSFATMEMLYLHKQNLPIAVPCTLVLSSAVTQFTVRLSCVFSARINTHTNELSVLYNDEFIGRSLIHIDGEQYQLFASHSRQHSAETKCQNCLRQCAFAWDQYDYKSSICCVFIFDVHFSTIS